LYYNKYHSQLILSNLPLNERAGEGEGEMGRPGDGETGRWGDGEMGRNFIKE